MRRVAAFVTLAGLSALMGCDFLGKTCTTDARAGVSVRVVGGAARAATGAEPSGCTVRVTAVVNGETDSFFCSVDGADCTCDGAWEQSGTFSVTVSSADRVVDSRTVVVGKGDCHVQGVAYTVALPADAGSRDAP